MVIQWYPGHMAKARRMLLENLKLIDVIVELVDARAPRSTSNPDFDELFLNKKRVIILNKSDLADKNMTSRWVDWYAKKDISALAYVSTSGSKKTVIQKIDEAASDHVRRMREKGVNKTVRVLVCGIPNVGKSTFINNIAGAVKAKTGDKPGVTKGRQWVKITSYLEMMDTPGLLWPKLDNEIYAQRLAFIGSIKDDIMNIEELAELLLRQLNEKHHDDLRTRYKMINEDSGILLEAVAAGRGFLLPGGKFDTERAARIVLDEFRAGRIVRATLDDPGEV